MKYLFSVMLLALVASTAAFAAPVQMQFNNAVGYSANGEYTYPYEFTVDGSPAQLMCLSFNNPIANGEIWQANVNTVASLWGTSDAALYDQAAWLLSQEKSNNYDPAINWAAWSLFAPNVDPASFPGAEDWLALAQQQKFHPGQFSNVLIFTPVGGSQSLGGTPQTLIGYSPVPEPSTLIMMGSAFLGVAGTLRRKLASSR